jgi:hypothetical protein
MFAILFDAWLFHNPVSSHSIALNRFDKLYTILLMGVWSLSREQSIFQYALIHWRERSRLADSRRFSSSQWLASTKISLLIIEWGYPICYNYSGYNNYIYTTLWIIIMFVSGIIKCWSSKTGGLRRRCKNNTLIDLTKIPYNKNGALCVAFSRGKHSLRFQVKQK